MRIGGARRRLSAEGFDEGRRVRALLAALGLRAPLLALLGAVALAALAAPAPAD
ncbi:hypothetical protein [Marichromatium sp. AB32]|nr:hypothetical protein [Marichromatium sp. AB32]